MKPIFVSPVLINKRILEQLEQKGLIQRFHCSQRALSAKENEVVDDFIYTTNPLWGPHALLCVGLNKTVIELASHPDNEDFILFNDSGPAKPLYLLISIHKRNELCELIKAQRITSEDFILLEVVFNDPQLSIFTMLANTPHAEVTVSGNAPAPCFFVTEPANLTTEPIEGDYKIMMRTT